MTKSKEMSYQGRSAQRADAGDRGRVPGDLVPGTHRTSSYMLPNLSLHGRPPEALFDDKESPPYSGLTGYQGGAGPMDDLGTERDRHKQPVRWTTIRHMDTRINPSDLLLYAPYNSPHHTGRGQDVGGRLRP